MYWREVVSGMALATLASYLSARWVLAKMLVATFAALGLLPS